MTLRSEIIKLAMREPALRRHLLPILERTAMEHRNEKDLQDYLRDHPNADRTKHTVKTPSSQGHGSPSIEHSPKALSEAIPAWIIHHSSPGSNAMGQKPYGAPSMSAVKQIKDMGAKGQTPPKEVLHSAISEMEKMLTKFPNMGPRDRKRVSDAVDMMHSMVGSQ